MTVKLVNRGAVGEYILEGRFDSNSSFDVQKIIEDSYTRFSKIIFNFDRLQYISSAGLRVLKITNSLTKSKGIDFSLSNVPPFVMEVLEMTGFAQILNIE